jgi:hypothetical protein
MLQAAKIIGAGLATIGLAGAGVKKITCTPNMKILGNKLTLNGKNPLKRSIPWIKNILNFF